MMGEHKRGSTIKRPRAIKGLQACPACGQGCWVLMTRRDGPMLVQGMCEAYTPRLLVRGLRSQPTLNDVMELAEWDRGIVLVPHQLVCLARATTEGPPPLLRWQTIAPPVAGEEIDHGRAAE
jgi:hypothetical protein